MAEVRLVDIYEPTTFDGRVQESAIELNQFIASGVLVRDPRIDDLVAVGGMVGELPFFHGLVNDEPDYTTDDPAQENTPAKVDSGTQIFRLANQAKSWSTMDLSRQLALQDPLGAITDRIGLYWAVNSQQRLISSAVGVYEDNLANDAGDMINDISIEDGDNAAAINLISAEAVIDTQSTLGDHSKTVTAIGMHSVIFAALKKQNLIDYIPNARGEIVIPTYLNLTVIEDDAMTVVAGGTTGFKYTTILFGQGAFSYGESAAMVPSETDRLPSKGNGGGQDILYTRRNEIIHPNGFAFLSASILQGISATRTQLQSALQWDRVYNERKNIPLAYLITNG